MKVTMPDINELLMGEDRVHFVNIGNEILRLDLEELEGETLEKSIKDLRETPEFVEEGLDKLKQLLAEDEGLKIPLDDDKYLMKFLRPNKFYPDSTFKMMRNYYKFKLKHPKYSADLRPNLLKHVFESNIVNILPKRTSSGERILVLHIGKIWDTSKVGVNDIFRALMMMLEVAMLEPKTQVGGVHVIIDVKGLTLSHIMQFTPSFASAVLTFVQECMPIRLKGIHIVNQPYIFNMLYAIFKPFIGEKLKKKIQFVGTNWNHLHEKVDKDCLPTYYKGEIEIVEYPGKLMGELLCEYDTEFELCEQIGYIPKGERSDG